MSDEDLRALERAAASDERARLRLAEALLRQKNGASKALRALQPLFTGETEAAGLARRRALAIVADVKTIDGDPSPAEAFAKLFGERLASIDEVGLMIREMPVSAMLVRVVLVRALRGRSKRAAIEVAAQLPPGDPLKGVLGAEGEVVI
jgi:hypothetical protein